MSEEQQTTRGPDKLAEAYLRHNEEDFWAWEEVQEAVRRDLAEGWPLILFLLGKAKDDGDIGYIAAGPLEDAVDMYGDRALDLAEEECKSNDHLRKALSSIAVLFYNDEFERWYNLLYRYGLRKERVAPPVLVNEVLGAMRSYLSDRIGDEEYAERVSEALDKPLDDKKAQQILQRVSFDIEVFDSTPLSLTWPRIPRQGMKQRVEQTMLELEQLGYQAKQ